MKNIVFVLLCLIGQFCYADCTDVLVGQRTWHSQPDYKENGKLHPYESNNYLLGCITSNDHIVAVFRNSYDDPTALGGWVWRTNELSSYVTPYLVLGTVVGYKDHLVHVGPFSPYGFVGIDLHPQDNKFGVMISTVGTITSIGVRFSY